MCCNPFNHCSKIQIRRLDKLMLGMHTVSMYFSIVICNQLIQMIMMSVKWTIASTTNQCPLSLLCVVALTIYPPSVVLYREMRKAKKGGGQQTVTTEEKAEAGQSASDDKNEGELLSQPSAAKSPEVPEEVSWATGKAISIQHRMVIKYFRYTVLTSLSSSVWNVDTMRNIAVSFIGQMNSCMLHKQWRVLTADGALGYFPWLVFFSLCTFSSCLYNPVDKYSIVCYWNILWSCCGLKIISNFIIDCSCNLWKDLLGLKKMMGIKMIIIIIIINLIYIVQFDTNGILTALYIVITYIQMQYVHVWTYMKQSYEYTYTCLNISKYTVTCANIYLPTY